MRTASRIDRIQPFHVMDLLARARRLEAEGTDIVHMEIGEPDFPTPEPVVAAGRSVLEGGRVQYTPALGLPALREKLAGYYAERYRVDLDPRRIVVTPGSSTGLQLVMAAMVDKGEEVLLTDPGYPCNRNFVFLVDGIPVALPVTADSLFQPTPAQVAAAWTERTRVLMVASPANPTGSVLAPEQLRGLQKVSADRDGTLVVDEIYQGLTYGGSDITALELGADNVIVVNSFSKYFGMTGWRVGWLVVPDTLVPVMDKLAQNLYLSAPTISQHAAIAALEPDTRRLLDERRDAFRQRRDFLHSALGELGFGIPASPAGAFYVYADCSAFAADSYRFAHDLLEQAGVAVTPGKDFGVHAPERHVRFAYTTDISRLEEGVRRIADFIGRT
jgi:aspartate/methionine/tyrosine aminotransferase